MQYTSGCWSFESGALIKILGLDGNRLKEQQYYHYDAVHWQDYLAMEQIGNEFTELYN
ncbi:PoNe immunity protein domain-containing protein [uncultured Pedobacter sp.]|uniref:PoNe immunity protein domain-containing protein n=1 Tax=uncultured Pedobacter sp. TaxID=246139 RepID=UPI00345DC213